MTDQGFSERRRFGYRRLAILLRREGALKRLLNNKTHDVTMGYGEPCNIGVRLGERSGHFVDLDFDCEEARELAGLPASSVTCCLSDGRLGATSTGP